MFRPAKTTWVELLIEREAAPRILAGLAADRMIELQRELPKELLFDLVRKKENSERLHRLEELKDRFAGLLPHADREMVSTESLNAPGPQALDDIEKSLTLWAQTGAALADQLRHVDAELDNQALLATCLKILPDEDVDLSYARETATNADRRFKSWLALGTDIGPEFATEFPGGILLQVYPAPEVIPHEHEVVLFGISDTSVQTDVERKLHMKGARFVRIPDWIDATPSHAYRQVMQRSATLSEKRQQIAKQLEQTNRETGVAGALWLLERHRWLAEVLTQTVSGKHFLWISGWVPQNRLDELARRLEQSQIPFLLRTDTDEHHGTAPVILQNPTWMSRFEIFVKSFGTPSYNEVDPSPVLAIVMPLMFGYMFGDVGQGIVLMLAGWLLRKRFPIMALFIPAGFAAIIFGFMFGSIFFNEGLLSPLWIPPLSDPLLILIVPLVLGVALIMVSMVFAGIEAHWRGEQATWWGNEFPLIVLYMGLPLSFFSLTFGLSLVSAAIILRLLTAAATGFRTRRVRGILNETGKALLILIESTVQLATNTFSFTRIGAFALAHAGLGLAVITMVEQTNNIAAQIVIWLLGNIVVLVLEGLVVSIQTARLVMFEFFRRFSRAEGRPFRPLMLPKSISKQRR